MKYKQKSFEITKIEDKNLIQSLINKSETIKWRLIQTIQMKQHKEKNYIEKFGQLPIMFAVR